MTSLRVARSEELGDDDWAQLTALCVAAFDEPWDGYWESIGPGVHVIAELPDGTVQAHACVVERLLYPGTLVVRTGYVEGVAVWPGVQRAGFGTLVMTEIGRLIDERYELGALGTGSHAFYERLGWRIWRGPTWIRHPDGRRDRSADEDGNIMVRLTPDSPERLDLTDPIAVDWRPGEVW
jgi:aminoglycoside 2'-N-acetyltransferase I